VVEVIPWCCDRSLGRVVSLSPATFFRYALVICVLVGVAAGSFVAWVENLRHLGRRYELFDGGLVVVTASEIGQFIGATSFRWSAATRATGCCRRKR
jgi:hypothetical protein